MATPSNRVSYHPSFKKSIKSRGRRTERAFPFRNQNRNRIFEILLRFEIRKMVGGTEAFPDLGKHCQRSSCNQLDFLPFICDGCQKVFCVEHRSYGSHECPKAEHKNRVVVICKVCSTSLEKEGDEEERLVLDRHSLSGNCDPSLKRKPKCPVKSCKQTLTFSNSYRCRTCDLKTCLKHRFPSDHACRNPSDKFLVALAARNGKDCGADNKISHPRPSPSVKAW